MASHRQGETKIRANKIRKYALRYKKRYAKFIGGVIVLEN